MTEAKTSSPELTIEEMTPLLVEKVCALNDQIIRRFSERDQIRTILPLPGEKNLYIAFGQDNQEASARVINAFGDTLDEIASVFYLACILFTCNGEQTEEFIPTQVLA